MKHRLYTILILLSITLGLSAQDSGKGKRSYVIGFYNLENLFDTYDDPAKNDEEFLPEGKNKWTEAKYTKKLHNMATVIRTMADANGRFHTILGVSEIENRLVLEDLVSQPEIADANYQIIKRGGFVQSESYSDEYRKKRDLFMISAGACFKMTYHGDVYDVSNGGKHPVYRYGKPIFWAL